MQKNNKDIFLTSKEAAMIASYISGNLDTRFFNIEDLKDIRLNVLNFLIKNGLFIPINDRILKELNFLLDEDGDLVGFSEFIKDKDLLKSIINKYNLVLESKNES